MQREKRKICRYYAHGKCVKQDCPFVHQQQTKKPCKFWAQTGYCRKGKNCQFYHATREQEKKDKKFVDKNKGQAQQKIQRNIQKKEQPKRVKLGQQEEVKKQEVKKDDRTEQEIKAQQMLTTQQSLAAKQQLLNQLQQTHSQNLQFFKQYPKAFPDHTKTLQIKQHIKKVEQRFFNNKPFLEILKQIPSKEQQQYYQIIRRYQDSFRLQNDEQPRVYFINLRPLLFNKQMNLHFVMDQPYIQLKINQKLYPQTKAHFQILNESIPNAYKHKFIELLNKYHQKHNLFDTLKFFQNSFQKNYQSVKFKLENQHFKKVELKQKIQQEKQKLELQEKQKQKTSQHHNHKNHHKQHQKKHVSGHHQKKSDNDEEQEGHPQVKPQRGHKQQQVHQKKQKKQHHKDDRYVNPPPVKPVVVQNIGVVQQQKIRKQFRDYLQMDFNQHQKPQHQNLNDEITVEQLVMHNCPYLVLEKILLYIQCNCSRVLMYLFDAEERKELKLWVKLKCKKCNDCVRIVWERVVVHNKGQLISRMSVANGKIIDVGGLGWKIGCNCDQEIIKPKLFLPGQRLQVNCFTCFANMTIQYNGIKHFNPFVKEFQMQQDKQLPLKGSCNHQKLNFRWIRYACCGRPFSCDQCHDLNAVKQHEIVNGITMICGYCAHEQQISDTCAKCKKELIKGQDKAGHWQGGLGCRDKDLLSKKDAKKYAGQGKTESNKHKKKEKEK